MNTATIDYFRGTVFGLALILLWWALTQLIPYASQFVCQLSTTLLSMTIDEFEKITSIILNIVTIIAVMVGGLWTYFHYFKGRLYYPRLELKVSGSVHADGSNKYLLTNVHLKNLGNRDFRIQRAGTGLRISSLGDREAQVDDLRFAHQNKLKTVRIFADHQWIESNESIGDDLLFRLPADVTTVMLSARLVSAGITWKANCVIVQTEARGKDNE